MGRSQLAVLMRLTCLSTFPALGKFHCMFFQQCFAIVTLNVLLRAIHRQLTERLEKAQVFSQKLCLQMDNCGRENRNKWVLAFLSHKLVINLLYNYVKNFTSILNCYIGPKCVTSNNVTKALSLCYNCFSLIFISRLENHLRTNKQLSNLLYNDVKNFTFVLSCSIGIKSIPERKDRKALSV